jgi:alpha-tubulin suppressor-like RCC1 family protein
MRVTAPGFNEAGAATTPFQLAGVPPARDVAAAEMAGPTAYEWAFFVVTVAGDIYALGKGHLAGGFQPTPYELSAQTGFTQLKGHARAIVSDGYAAHVLLDDGTLWGWGYDMVGAVGDGNIKPWTTGWDGSSDDTYYVAAPVQVLDGVAEIFERDGAFYNWAVKLDGTLWTWGRNDSGQLGNGKVGGTAGNPDSADAPTPAQVYPF